MATEIWLIRHGETEWSRTGQYTGRTDLPLTARGEREALQLVPVLAAVSFDAILCSPLQRARRTCELAGYGGVATLEPDCMEWDYGALNGVTRDAYCAAHPGWNIWDGPVPGGEPLTAVAARATRVLARLAAVQGRAALFAHGHFLRILTATYLGLPAVAARHFALATGHVSILGQDNGFPAITAWNR
jgi:probable phosphoglycerate mutase